MYCNWYMHMHMHCFETLVLLQVTDLRRSQNRPSDVIKEHSTRVVAYIQHNIMTSQ